MTALVLGMLRSRWARAVMVAVLTALATVAAVAGPVYVARTDRHIVATEVARAAPAERNILVTGTVSAGNDGNIPTTFERLAGGWLDAPGYTAVFSAQFVAQPADQPFVAADQLNRVVYREGLCEHVVVVAGRCLMGTGDAVLGVSAARRLGLRPGDAVSLKGSIFDEIGNRYLPVGPPAPLTVVGIVRARDVTEHYWGSGGGSVLSDAADPAFAVDRRTLATFTRPAELQSYDAYPRPGAIGVEHLDDLRTWLDDADSRRSNSGKLTTGLSDLIERIDERRAQVRRTVPFAVAPVLVLAWAVIVLAVSAATRARRFEHGVIALRGVGRPGRWWLATGETLLPMLAGAVAGFTAAGGWSTPDAPAYAAVAVLGAVLAGLAVGVRTVSAPPVALLRRVDARGGRWGARIAVFAAVAAAAATVQVRGSGGGLAGLAPALVLLVAALLTAVAAPPLAARLGGAALRRGRLTAGLAGLWLARRPSAARLLAVLVVALSSLGFAAAATTGAQRQQQERAEAEAGAPVVLSVGAATRRQLLAAVRAADPGGRHAMAVVPLSGALAVDAPRLASTALWPGGGPAPADLGARLHPAPLGAPATVTGTSLRLDITVTRLARPDDALSLSVAPLDGRPTVTAELGSLYAGRRTYVANVPCAAGCRLVQLAVRVAPYEGPPVELTVHGAPVTTWQAPPGATVTVAGSDLSVVLPAGAAPGAGVLRPADGPAVLPVAGPGPLPPDGLFVGFDGRRVPTQLAAGVARLPRLGGTGLLVDLEYVDRLSVDSSAKGAEVWLSADAPPALTDALAAAGLTITSRRTLADARAALADEGTALGLRFYLIAGLFAVVLAGAALFGGRTDATSADLAALRAQGLAARRAAAVEPLAAVLLVVVAGLVAAPAAAVAWVAAAPPELRGAPPPAGPAALALAAAVAGLAVLGMLTATRRRTGS